MEQALNLLSFLGKSEKQHWPAGWCGHREPSVITYTHVECIIYHGNQILSV